MKNGMLRRERRKLARSTGRSNAAAAMATQTLSPRAQAEDDAIVPDAKRSHAEDVLSFQEISHLNDRKVSLKDSHFGYLQQHPELRSILADFTAAVLLEKPMKIFPFAAEHFAGLAQSPESGPPMLVRGSPARRPAPDAKAAARGPRARCRPTRGRRRCSSSRARSGSDSWRCSTAASRARLWRRS